jgi:hypothetical protein
MDWDIPNFFARGAIQRPHLLMHIVMSTTHRWVLGWYAGNVYVEHVQPVYFSNPAELTAIVEWSQITPHEFGGFGKLVGALAGMAVIAAVNSKLLTQRILSLCEKEVTDPVDIASTLGKNVRLIHWKLNRLSKTG